jgi:cyclohexanone monooxygenase
MGDLATVLRASAIQYVPEIAADTAHLTVFWRTPIWASPRYDEPFTPEQQELFERAPAHRAPSCG